MQCILPLSQQEMLLMRMMVHSTATGKVQMRSVGIVQALEMKLEDIRRSKAGSAAPTSADPQVQGYNILDDSSSEDDED